MSLTKTAVIPFFKPTVTHGEWEYLKEIEAQPDLLSKKEFSNRAIEILREYLEREVFLTKSCTQALELAAVLCNIRPGDEIIMPSFGFVSCANAFVTRGAKMAFADIRPDTMNLDENLIEQAVTPKTKAIVTINYSGVGCEYEVIKAVAQKHRLLLVEDNAHGIIAKYKDQYLGTFGDLSTFSFDHLKNITCGQGGAIAFKDSFPKRHLEYYYEFGTNKAEFIRGKADNYEWKSEGSNFYLSEILSAFLYAQLSNAEKIISNFRAHWIKYQTRLNELERTGAIQLPFVPVYCEHNAHNFFIKTANVEERTALMSFLRTKGIFATFHYVPLHSSEFGKLHGRFHGEDQYTTKESERLLRLPLYYALTSEDIERVCGCVYEFYGVKFSR